MQQTDVENKSTANFTEFLWNKVVCILKIEDNFLHLKCIKAPLSHALPLSSYNKSVELVKVISTSCEQDTWKVDEQGESILELPVCFNFRPPKSSPCFALIIYFWSKSEKHCRKLQEIKLQTKSEKSCTNTQGFIQKKLNTKLQEQGYVRPHNLLMILNPIAGKKKAKSLHKNLISPILQKAGVKETVVTTQYKGHVIEYLKSADLSAYDGIVAVGGDGSFSEAVSGVLMREQQKHGISLDGESNFDKPIQFAKPSVKFGCIPSGSYNLFNSTSQGTTDPETATLQIICGENHPLDVSSIYDDEGRFLKFSVLTSSYGFPSDFLMTFENLRGFGPARPYIALMLSFAKLRSYSCEITYITQSSDQIVELSSESTKCEHPCSCCAVELNEINRNPTLAPITQPQQSAQIKASSNTASSSMEDLSTDESCYKKVVREKSFSVNLVNIPCKYKLCPGGISPFAHLSDGKFDVILINKASRWNLLNVVKTTMSPTENYLEHPIVKSRRVLGMHFRVPSDDSKAAKNEKDSNTNDPPSASPSTSQEQEGSLCHRSCWTVDGDKTFDNVNITMWMHRGLINIFSKGYEKDMVEETSASSVN